MLRDFKFLRRGKNEEPENIPVNQRDFAVVQISSDPSRPPLNSIQDRIANPKPEQDVSNRSKVERTPNKAKGKASESPALPLRTPDKHGGAFSAKHRFGWAGQKNEHGDDLGNSSVVQLGGRGVGVGNMTPRGSRTVARPPVPSFSECASTQSTPTKSVSKPPSSVSRGKVDGAVGFRGVNLGTVYKGSTTVVNSVEVPHFDLKEDPSFWMEHNVQVLIRVRPLNSMERSNNGYSRCLKQESAQAIGWIGHPESRFRFDHVACETVDQEMLFRMACLPMVENCLSGYNSCMFAYGQTGSGKTYTMLGEIGNLEIKPSPHRGMTPRIFEFLFARIQAEEESRRDEKLKYSCKCSFLEIYNEQITDLLDPSSTNLLLREDNKNGVYVENLTEFEVHTVSDILSLLTQGSSNRKVAATNMNRESSRSHSVFMCVIESKWEKDSTTNLRFARLNLVDLAGSERQKTSGAEGERLKEAANINKSLSTLGHVIMVLVDVAQGKPRHIPYRDSKLTFLLQDSLGGNSKTMIIANVSPSICSASETLNTLKFAQRAKMIQNNAVVNEDSTGDVTALQHQIRLLKEELYILKRQNVSRSLRFGQITAEDTTLTPESSFSGHVCDMDVEDDGEFLDNESKGGSVRMSSKQLKCLETTLAGALRREKMAEAEIKQLEAEIEQLNRLVRQREEDSRSSKMMLRFREDKIQRMESIVNGSIPAENYLREETRVLSEEIQLLQAKLDRNPEVTRFAHENIRLLEQLRRYQEFYEEGEKDILLTEVSNLRDQLLQSIDGNSKQLENQNLTSDIQESDRVNQKNDSLQQELDNTHSELAECRRHLNSCLSENENLSRELESLRSMFIDLKSSLRGQEERTKVVESKHEPTGTEDAEEILNLQLELDILKIILKEEKSSSGEMEEKLMGLSRELEIATEETSLLTKNYSDTERELEEARSVIEALESQQILTINEVEELRSCNNRKMQILSQQEITIKSLKEQLSLRELKKLSPSNNSENGGSLYLKKKVKKMQCSLENAKRLNTLYRTDRESQVSNDEDMDEVRKQVEEETAEVIVCLEEELAVLQQEVQERHQKEAELNKTIMLLETELKEGHKKVRTLSEEWSLLSNEIEEVLSDGWESLTDVSNQLEHTSSSVPQNRIWISENVGRMARALSEKELLIEELRRCLEDANNTRSDVESMLKSLRGATLAITEANQRESTEREKIIVLLKSQLSAEKVTSEKLQKDNYFFLESEQKSRESMSSLTAQLLTLQAMMGDFERQSQFKMEAAKQRLEAFEHFVLGITEACLQESTEKDKSIVLLKSQLSMEKAALEKLQLDNNILLASEEKSKDSMTCLTAQLLTLKAMVSNFECQSQLKMDASKQRLEALERVVLEARSHSHELKSVLESEADDAKLVAVQHAAEAACVLSKFEEAQDTIKEADIIINGLVIENERMKLELKLLKKAYRSLGTEKRILDGEFQNLQSVNNLRSQRCDQLLSDLGEAQASVSELEGIVAELQIASEENFTLLASDFQAIKAQLFDSSKLVRTWLEEIWSEIILKDCAVSVLHLCHMGVLLETATGLNAENGLLQHGLCESNGIIADLREHNSRSIKELDMCRAVKGKLLADIKSAFDRISRKEDESQELTIKMTTFDKKIMDLQSQETLMLQRSNYIGSQLALLMSDLDSSNRNLAATLLDQEKALESRADFFMGNWCMKEFESVYLTSELEEMALRRADAERTLAHCDVIFENLKKELVTLKIDSELKDQILQEKEVNVSTQLYLLDQKNQDLYNSVNVLETQSYELKNELERKETELNRMLLVEKENNLLRVEIDQLKEDRSLLSHNLQAKNLDVESSLSLVTSCDVLFENLKKELVVSKIDSELRDQILTNEESRLHELKKKLEIKETELTRMHIFEKENELLRVEIDQLKEENSSILQNLQAKKSEVESSSSLVTVLEKENQSLQVEILAMETRIDNLQTVLEVKSSELRGIQLSQHAITEELCLNSQELETYATGISALKEENILLQGELECLKRSIDKCFDSVDGKLLYALNEEEGFKNVDETLQERSESMAKKTQEFVEQLEQIKCRAKDLEAEKTSLQTELLRKDEILEGLQFDLSLLQESASKTKDQTDKIKEIISSLDNLEDELSTKTDELEEAIVVKENLRAEILEQSERVSDLESELSKESRENASLRDELERTLVCKRGVEEELAEANKVKESLETENLEMGSTIDRRNSLIETLRRDIIELERERDELLQEMASLKDRLEAEQARADESDAIAKEAQEWAESRNVYAEEKEAISKLLERSVQELEDTINVLQEESDITRGEADRQRLLREEMEMELLAVKQQLHNVQNVDAEFKSYLEEKEKNLQEVHTKVQVLERDIKEKDLEISQLKKHIAELNLHAEAQASEYKQKFKALEAMVENVKSDNHFIHTLNSSSPKKSEKFSARPRGSGSPFKCIGLGISQQIRSERDEEISVARQRIEELESLVATQQKEIFSLNATLAKTDSMTHDLMRDLLGVKLNMTACSSLGNDQQIREITDKVRLHNLESDVMDQEVAKLRKQLKEFIKERQVWLDEIDRNQTEVKAAQITLEELHQQNQSIKSENNILKIESVNHQQRVKELEGEVKKLSGHQNLHQRIHHHAKIKEENNTLKAHNEELSTKVRRAEAIIERVKEELDIYRASSRKNSILDFDEVKRLRTKLKETEEEKVQLAQKLLGLCSSALKAAGITKPATEISPAVAEDALEMLKHTLTVMDRELEDLKYKYKITKERMRLSELMPQVSTINSREDENRKTPRRDTQSPYFSPLDR